MNIYNYQTKIIADELLLSITKNTKNLDKQTQTNLKRSIRTQNEETK